MCSKRNDRQLRTEAHRRAIRFMVRHNRDMSGHPKTLALAFSRFGYPACRLVSEWHPGQARKQGSAQATGLAVTGLPP